LLRLLLLLNCKIRTNFYRVKTQRILTLKHLSRVAPEEVEAPVINSPRSSSRNSISRSDGRCVQRAGTHSRCVDDTPIQGIPCSSTIIAKYYPHHEMDSKISFFISNQVKLSDHFIVIRVQPKASKGITDLLSFLFLLIVSQTKRVPLRS